MLDDYTLDNDDLTQINCRKTFKVSVVNNIPTLESIVKKSNLLGFKVTRLRKHVYAITNNEEVTVLSPRKIELDDCYGTSSTEYEGRIKIFNSTEFTDIYLNNTIVGQQASYSSMFEGDNYTCGLCKTIDLSGIETSNQGDMTDMFANQYNLEYLDLGSIDTSEVVTAHRVFLLCQSLKKIHGIENIDTSKMTYTIDMFSHCTKLEELNIKNLDFDSLQHADRMFKDMNNIKSIEMHGLTGTNLRGVSLMFDHCASLEYIALPNFKLNKQFHIDTRNMFNGCYALREIDFTNLNLTESEIRRQFNLPGGVKIRHHDKIIVT